MKNNSISESSSTRGIKVLMKKINSSSPLRDSVFEDAIDYFTKQPEVEARIASLTEDLSKAEQRVSKNTMVENTDKLKTSLKICQKNLKSYELELDNARLARVRKLNTISDEVLSQCSGKNEDETNRKFAKTLGTVSLIAPTLISTSLDYNKQNKAFYQTVLSLKLLDQLLADKQLDNDYILSRLLPKELECDELSSFRLEVQTPLVIASLLMDIGNYHPEAQKILKGDLGDKDEYRLLEQNERITLLKLNHRHSLNYLTDGLGLNKYIGNLKDERDVFNKQEENKFAFIRFLLKGALSPKQGLGGLVKVPHIYTSVILSTKRSFTYESLPRAFVMLSKGVEKKILNKGVVTSLLTITGIFPQGFGIVYIPKSTDGSDLDNYEYAIVNSLYPKEAQSPTCRTATKGLVFNSSGQDCSITPSNNLFFIDARKKLETIDKERLKEILSKLWDNFENLEGELELVPKCWGPYEFFYYAKQQNLWNKQAGD